jgi:hypothetical protein
MSKGNAVRIEVIRTELTRRGDGKSVDTPMRTVTEYWDTLTGEKLAEKDHFGEGWHMGEIRRLAQALGCLPEEAVDLAIEKAQLADDGEEG